MADKRTEVLCAGLLIKSPAKHEIKAGFAFLWKVRWCVLQRITYIGSRTEGCKLEFCYYKNEDEFRNEKLPYGILTIYSDTDIRSYYGSQAGFDHLFSITPSGHKTMKLSAPSCRLRSHWITVLYYHMSLCSPNDSPNRRRHSSVGSKASSDSGLKSRTSSQGSVGSTSSSLKRSDSKSSHESTEGAFADGANRMSGRSRTRSVLRFLEKMIPKLKGPAKCNEPINISEEVEGEEEEDQLRRIYSHVFMLCETCQREPSKRKEKSSGRRKGSIKKECLQKHGNKDIETEKSAVERRASSSSEILPLRLCSFVSKDSAITNDDSDAVFEDRLYSMIDEKWLSTVHEIMNKKEGVNEAIEEGSGSKDKSGDDCTAEEKSIEECYVPMNVIKEEVNAIQLQEAETAKSASEGAEAKKSHFAVRANLDFKSGYKSVLFEMTL